MNASGTNCFSIDLARIRISNVLTFAQHCFKLRSAARRRQECLLGETMACLSEVAYTHLAGWEYPHVGGAPPSAAEMGPRRKPIASRWRKQSDKRLSGTGAMAVV